MWFEGVIRDHLDVGPAGSDRFDLPSSCESLYSGKVSDTSSNRGGQSYLVLLLQASRIKQYFKGAWALRTETVICDTRDFGIGRRVCGTNWDALRAVGEAANRRLCDAEAADTQPAPDVATSR
jgi:hypothetical protein